MDDDQLEPSEEPVAPPAPPLALERDQTVAEGIARIVTDLIDDARWRLEHHETLGVASAVHETRKRCKEARGIVRLAHGGLSADDHRATIRTLRDAGRLLSEMRDDQAMLGTLDALIGASVGAIPRSGVGAVRATFRERAQRAARPDELRLARLERSHVALGEVRARIDSWVFVGDGFEVLESGLRRTYERARSTMHAVAKGSDPKVRHEWRKRVKDGWYQARALEPAAPSVLTQTAAMCHRLSDALGDLHDLDVILATTRRDPESFGGLDQVAALESIATPVQHELQRRALALGHRIYSEPPSAHAARMMGYLDVWQSAGSELEVGAIAELYDARDELDPLTTTELRRLAGIAGVSGRSSMRRTELLVAIRASGILAGRAPVV